MATFGQGSGNQGSKSVTMLRMDGYAGYTLVSDEAPDALLTRVGRGTPGGEYLRRFWQPIAYLHELTDVPLRARLLGEDLVVFKDRRGEVGVLFLHCSHRGTSLEYGLIAERGIRCCYHGRVYDVDGTVLDMPGEPAADRLKAHVRQGAYPVHVFGGIVFTYMGPPDQVPPFPSYDRFDLPGVQLAPGPRLPFACNWVQIKENAMDPAHTAVLHAIEGQGVFSEEFGKFPEIAWMETPVGTAYFAIRHVGDNVWVRSTDVIMPNIHSITSIFEDGHTRKQAGLPWLTIWTAPVDDENSINFCLCHMAEGDDMPLEQRLTVMGFGQTPNRPYAERQRIPGDYDAMVSQGPVAIHEREQLGSLDAGVILFRRCLRKSIEAVQRGEDPLGLLRESGFCAETYGTDLVIPAGDMPGDSANEADRRAFLQQLAARYLAEPPFRTLRRESVAV